MRVINVLILVTIISVGIAIASDSDAKTPPINAPEVKRVGLAKIHPKKGGNRNDLQKYQQQDTQSNQSTQSAQAENSLEQRKIDSPTRSSEEKTLPDISTKTKIEALEQIPATVVELKNLSDQKEGLRNNSSRSQSDESAGDETDNSSNTSGASTTLRKPKSTNQYLNTFSSDVICNVSSQKFDGQAIIPYCQSMSISPVKPTCMGDYAAQRAMTECTRNIAMTISNFFFFEPNADYRLERRIFVIQSIGALFTVRIKDSKDVFEVLPVWLRNGALMCFYRSADGKGRWNPVMKIATSTLSPSPFMDNSQALGVEAGYVNWVVDYNKDFAGSIWLEAAATELYALGDEFPATTDVDSWKTLLEFIGFRSWQQEEKHKLSLTVNEKNLERFTSYNVAHPVIKSNLVPKEDLSTHSQIYNSVAGGLKGSIGYGTKITHGWTISQYPEIFSKSHADSAYNHLLLISGGDLVVRGKLVFYEIFTELLNFLKDPILSKIPNPTRYVVGTPVKTDNSSFLIRKPEEPSTVCTTSTGEKKETETPESAEDLAALLGITHNPIVDLQGLIELAEVFIVAAEQGNQTAAGIVAEIIYRRIAHRASIILTSDCALWVTNPQYQPVARMSQLWVLKQFIANNKDYLAEDCKEPNQLSRHDILEVFGLRMALSARE